MALAGTSVLEEAEAEGTEGSIMSKLCDNCAVEHCADRNRGQVIFCSSHTAKPIQTHADRIRAENDDGLKETIYAFSLGFKPWCDFHCENEGDDGCDKCIENWLKQPAEVSDHA